MMQLVINGQTEIIDGDRISLEDVLRSKGVSPETVAIEMNLTIVPKSAYRETFLIHGDKIEVVRYVGGGCQ